MAVFSFSPQAEEYVSQFHIYITHLETTNNSLAHTNALFVQENTTLRSTVQRLETENEDQRTALLALEEEADDLEDDVEYLMDELEELRERAEKQTGKMKAIVQEAFNSNVEKGCEESSALNKEGRSPLVSLPQNDGASHGSPPPSTL
jgi:predicted  nucleic acid-binding Zn-ribbon protein